MSSRSLSGSRGGPAAGSAAEADWLVKGISEAISKVRLELSSLVTGGAESVGGRYVYVVVGAIEPMVGGRPVGVLLDCEAGGRALFTRPAGETRSVRPDSSGGAGLDAAFAATGGARDEAPPSAGGRLRPSMRPLEGFVWPCAAASCSRAGPAGRAESGIDLERDTLLCGTSA